ncbi:response regulator [Methylobacterium tardum]|uniref:Response regulatory domain-containing protein n=1 Tax=Methylobacterium tardum TaxID=374432 RepID=A0AA37T7J1_9HYPH|nr:response regulator [Methylobacterium tardum]URD39527.1 response regulator [Methylobacterium tardum]GLS68225.1 hypothetical protein GCM10007890_02370 [Methylobacterium tardum]
MEDDYFIASDLAGSLKTLGAEVVGLVASAEDAIEKVIGGGFDLAALDVGLLDGMTFEVAQALRTKSIPFVFITGYSSDVIPAAYADVPRLEKPCTIAELVRHIGVLCRSEQPE